MRRRPWIPALLLVALLGATAAAQPLSKDEQACVAALHQGRTKVAKAVDKEVQGCVKAGAKAKLATSIETCSVADAKGKIAKAESKTADFESKKCTGVAPPYGATNAAVVNGAASDQAYGLAHDVFGPDLDVAVASFAEDKARSVCQSAVAKSVSLCRQMIGVEFDKCSKAGLKHKTTPIASTADLEACLGADPKGKIAGKCDLRAEVKPGKFKLDGIRKALAKKCVGKGVDLPAAFPGCGRADAERVHECMRAQIRCRACLAVNAADDLGVDCDVFDDGNTNGSCPPFALGRHSCTLDDASHFLFDSGAGFAIGALDGTLNVACGNVDPATGETSCTCGIENVAPVEVFGVGWACITPAAGCAPGRISCSGGPSLDFTIEADHDIGACSGHGDCATQCQFHCASAGGVVRDSGCEGYCDGGSTGGLACTADADCLGGACRGEPAHGNVCQCQCIDTGPALGGGPSRPGGTRCDVGVAIRVEAALPCDGADVLVSLPRTCVPFTTETAQAVLHDQDTVPGTTLGGDILTGIPLGCSTLEANSSGLVLVSGITAFDASGAGDVHLAFDLGCE